MVGINVRVQRPNILCAGELARPYEGVFSILIRQGICLILLFRLFQ